MTLFDTIDGAFMSFAYGWAFSRPVRKLFYNITITGLSAASKRAGASTSAARSRRQSVVP
jgi:high-affinity nickel permease